MLRTTVLFLFCFSSTTIFVDSARILGIFTMPSISHQVVFRALTFELAKRGHELVIFTPNPALPMDRPPDNITEIDTGKSYQILAEMMERAFNKNVLKRGVVMSLRSMNGDGISRAMLKLVSSQFDLPEVKKIIEDKTQKFDLVIIEPILNFPLIVSRIFNAPVILFSSLYGYSEIFEIMGALSWHPMYYPSFYRTKYKDLSFLEKIGAIYLEWRLITTSLAGEEKENELLKTRFGPDAPTVAELKENVQMLFLNAHPIMGNNRPVPPSVVYLGNMHLQPVKELPQDLKSYLDASYTGVVYVSFGTNVRPSNMDQDFLDAFLDAFESLPYDILWKYDGNNNERIPKNVKIQKWFPQRDLLMHPNIKVFVTQGGLQSTDEAIDAAVPLVGIPMIVDQWYNVNKYVELGIGVQIDALTMTADDLSRAIRQVIEDDSFRQNIKRVRSLMNDQPQRPLERAVWWTEHVLRHGGAHLRAPSANTTWTEYLMADVLAIILGSILVFISLVIWISCKILKLVTGKIIKLKQN